MYQGFNLVFRKEDLQNYAHYESVGNEIYRDLKQSVLTFIQSFKKQDGHLDGTKMQSNWFPPIKADVFLSHSHIDESLAIALAGYLYEEFGLRTFIDSCLWSNYKSLLKMLDEEYSFQPEQNTYDYELSIYTASHAHLMLQTALANQIDTTECVIFLNTPNSIKPNEVVHQTVSPWIYNEISMTRLIRRRSREEHHSTVCFSQEALNEGVQQIKIDYNVSLDHLTDIDVNAFIKMEGQQRIHQLMNLNYNGLDNLYLYTQSMD